MLTRSDVEAATEHAILDFDEEKAALCATVRELREVLIVAMGGYTACTMSIYNDPCDCSFCVTARRVREALK